MGSSSATAQGEAEPAPGQLGIAVSDRDPAGRVAGWRERELARASCQLPPAGYAQVASGLHQLVVAVGEGYGTITRGLVPV
jgi:hypothetical protein